MLYLKKNAFIGISSSYPKTFFLKTFPIFYLLTEKKFLFKYKKDVFSFRDRFDNYVFVDAKSNEYPAIVEFAPYQRRPKVSDADTTPKKDAKCNTLEQDADYAKFLEQFDKPVGDALPTCEAILEVIFKHKFASIFLVNAIHALLKLHVLLRKLSKKSVIELRRPVEPRGQRWPADQAA